MSWTKPEQQIVAGIEKNVTDLVNVIKGDYEPGTPGMAESLRNVQEDTVEIRIQLRESNKLHTRVHKRLWQVLAGVGVLSLLALVLHLTVAGQLVMSLLELAIKWVT